MDLISIYQTAIDDLSMFADQLAVCINNPALSPYIRFSRGQDITAQIRITVAKTRAQVLAYETEARLMRSHIRALDTLMGVLDNGAKQ